jgi:NAD(P)-dependent dehydrogenase (short-subunit alcohol dehydrogenase family)
VEAGRVIVITGASSGVGRATARAFAERGARLGLLARGRDGLAAARTEVENLGGAALAVPTDVSDPEALERAAAAVEREYGPPDVWVNNAMVSVFSPVAQLEADEIRRVTETTYLGTVYGTLAALRRMLPRDRGTIVQVGSALAYRAIPLQAAYCAAKHAIQGFTESLRSELLHDESGVRVTMVQLPALNTPHFGVVKSRLPRHPQPLPPIYQPEVAARAIVWAADNPDRRELWAGGSTVKTLLAEKVASGLLDRYLGRVGYEGQQTDEPVLPERPSNLSKPLPGDRGAHGIFDGDARERSIQLWLATHRGVLLALSAGALAARRVLR